MRYDCEKAYSCCRCWVCDAKQDEWPDLLSPGDLPDRLRRELSLFPVFCNLFGRWVHVWLSLFLGRRLAVFSLCDAGGVYVVSVMWGVWLFFDNPPFLRSANEVCVVPTKDRSVLVLVVFCPPFPFQTEWGTMFTAPHAWWTCSSSGWKSITHSWLFELLLLCSTLRCLCLSYLFRMFWMKVKNQTVSGERRSQIYGCLFFAFQLVLIWGW